MLTAKSLETIEQARKLDDNIVNFFLCRLRNLVNESAKGFYYIYNPYLYGNIHRKNISRWTADADIFSFPYMVIPIHINTHWIVCVTHYAEKEGVLEYALYDSLSQNATPVKSVEKVMKNILTYLESEWKKLRSQYDFPRVRACKVTGRYIQKNDYECGVCMIHFIEVFTKGTKDVKLSDCIKRTVTNFNSKIATEVRVNYRAVIRSYYEKTNKLEETPSPSRSPSETETESDSTHSGISNPGAIHCYSNAVLQALFANREMMKDLRKLFLSKTTKPDSFIKEFLETGERVVHAQSGVIDITNLRNMLADLPLFKNLDATEQQDPHEYLALIFEELDHRIGAIIGKEKIPTEENPLFNHFGFEVSHAYRCNKCNYESGGVSTSKILSVVNFECTGKESTPTISDLIDHYFKEDCGINWKCRNRCNSTATSFTELLRCPPTAIIYLTHPTLFTFSGNNNTRRSGKLQPIRLTRSFSLGISAAQGFY